MSVTTPLLSYRRDSPTRTPPPRSPRSIGAAVARIVVGMVLFLSFVGVHTPHLYGGAETVQYKDPSNTGKSSSSRVEYPKAHPACKGSQHQMETYDATELLHETLPNGFEGACMFNPAILRYKNDVFLWIYRAYHAKGCKKCEGMNSYKYGPWIHGWDENNLYDTHFMITALVEHDPTTGQPIKVLYSKPHYHINRNVTSMRLDGRLFRDNKGNIQLIHTRIYQDYGDDWIPEGWIHDTVGISKVTITIDGEEENSKSQQRKKTQKLEQNGGFIDGLGSLGEDGYLNADIVMEKSVFLPLRIDEWQSNDGSKNQKNWVPFNSTSLTAYTHFPLFTPHSVIDWKNFTSPPFRNNYDSMAHVWFLYDFDKTRTNTTRVIFSGGTPMIKEDSGTWLGIGHALSKASVWHNTTGGVKPKVVGWAVKNFEGQPEPHLMKDYFAFFYRVEKKPPYRWTHISKAFKTPLFPMADGTRYVNNGVVYPMNIEKLGSDKYMISYGEDDALLRIGVMPKSRIEESLMPISSKKDVKKALKEFEFCTYRLEGEEM